MSAKYWMRNVLIVTFLGIAVNLPADDIWIVQTPMGSTPGGTGTQVDPYTVPVGNTTSFDTIVSGVSVKTAIRIGAGTFLTQGTNGVHTVQIPDGCALYGSGMGITTVKLADNSWSSGSGVVILMNPSSHASGYQAVVRDLTIDANFSNQDSSTTYSNGISGAGHSFLVEAVEIINLGSRSGEAFGMFIGNIGASDIDKPSNVIIRNCKVHHPWSGSTAGMSAIHPTGNNVWGGVIEDCYVDLSEAPSAIRAAYAFAGAPQGLVIANNTAIGASRGVHVDTPGGYSPKAARNVIIRSNRIYKCDQGIGIGAESDTPLMTDHFENFTIESNAIEMIDGGIGIALWGSTKGFLVKNNTILKNPNATSSVYRKGIYVSSGAESHMVVGNRFGPGGDPYFEDIEPVYYTQDAAKKNHFEDNTWTTDTVSPKQLDSLRLASGSQPAGTSLWRFSLGGAESDANPTTSLLSSDLDGSNRYDYFRLSRAPGGATSGYNIVLDPFGTSGVYVGDADSGNLEVGGWMVANAGFIMELGSRLRVKEGTGGRMGAVTLVAGQATVSTSAVNSNSRIFLTPQQDGGTPGAVRVSSRVAGSSFVISSASATDTSVVAWLIVDP